MASSDEVLKPLLVEVGSSLQKPPTSVKDLLALLDRVEVYLSRVEQSPSNAIQNALSPTMKALVGDDLLRHADVDVKVAVASCISEITRITAPEVPYEDDQMKEVFQLIVSSFESLPDMSSQSYIRRTSILETVAKVRSSVVMLDLECDGLILEMFRHFIKAIRDYHPENVYSCMESIMTRVIDESEEISSDLLFCIMDSVRKDNKEVMPIAQKLMKQVIEACADKLKPYIEIAVRTKVVSLADYDEMVSLICNEVSAETIVQSEQPDASGVNVVDAGKPVISSADIVLTAEETQTVIVNATELPAGGSSEMVTSNGNAGVEVDTLSGSSTLQDSKTSNVEKASETVSANPSATVRNPDNPVVETDTKASETIMENPEIKDGDLEAYKVDEGESTTKLKAEKIVKKRGRKAKAKKKASEPKSTGKSGRSVRQLDVAESHKSCSKDISPSPDEAIGHSSPKPSEAHDGPSMEICGESADKLNGSSKSTTEIGSSENHVMLDEKTTLVSDSKEETTPPTVDTSELKTFVSVVDGSVDKTNALTHKSLENTTTPAIDGEQEVAAPTIDGEQEVAAPTIDEPKEEIETSAGMSPEQVVVLSEDAHTVEDSPNPKENSKKRGRGKGKATLKKLAAQAAVEDDTKEATTSQNSAMKPVNGEEAMKVTPKMSKKREHIEITSAESKDYGEELVGSKVKVWWPADKRFYEGVVESFNSAKKKHKVLYADGEVENLVLKKQRWEVISPDEESDTDEEMHQETPATEKRHKAMEANEGTPKKRLGRPPSSKSKSASDKPGRKLKDHAKSDSKFRDDSKSGAKAKSDNSKEEEKTKVEGSKKLGRPKASGRSSGDEPSSSAAGKSKTDGSTAEDAKSSGKPKGRGTKSGNATPVIKSAGKPKTKELIKSKSGSATKEDTSKVVSDAKTEGVSLKAAPKSSVKASARAEVKEQTPGPALAAVSSKRKAPFLEKGNKNGAKAEVKVKKGRKH